MSGAEKGGCFVKKGFTLIELLAVIGIIMLLAGLLFPAFRAARESARRAKAKADVKQVDTAFKSVLLDYRVFDGGLSPSGSGQDMDSGKVAYLRGGNTKGVVYMEFDQAAITGGFADPWSKPAQPQLYRVALKNSTAGEAVTIVACGETIARQVAVWSKGIDRTEGTKDDVKSWE